MIVQGMLSLPSDEATSLLLESKEACPTSDEEDSWAPEDLIPAQESERSLMPGESSRLGITKTQIQ